MTFSKHTCLVVYRQRLMLYDVHRRAYDASTFKSLFGQDLAKGRAG